MEDMKMFAEEVVEKHNCVYRGKWHIVSPEGFYLPEWLEYLKINADHPSLQAIKNGKIETIISITNLKGAVESICRVLEKEKAYGVTLELKNCGTLCFDGSLLVILSRYVRNIIIKRATLTFEDLSNLVKIVRYSDASYHMSKIVFEKKNWSLLDGIASFHGEGCRPFKIFEIRDCNLIDTEKDMLRRKLECCNVLIEWCN